MVYFKNELPKRSSINVHNFYAGCDVYDIKAIRYFKNAKAKNAKKKGVKAFHKAHTSEIKLVW